jgi:RNA polymerase-binding transcription factor DksA
LYTKRNKGIGMDTEDLEYCKNLIFKKRQELLETDNFTNWFGDKNDGNPNEGGDRIDFTICPSRKNQSKNDENDIHSKAKILQYLLQLDHALSLIRKGNYGICRICNVEIPIKHLKKIPITQYCPRCE